MTPKEKSTSDGNEITKRVVSKTKGGKELMIDQNGHGYFFIKFSSGGQLPKELKGIYTKYEFAKEAVTNYMIGK